MKKLEKARLEIDEIDKEMASLFSRRMAAAKEIALYKKEHGLSVLDKKREELIIARNTQWIEGQTEKDHYASFLKNTIAVSRAYQSSIIDGVSVAFSGTVGAFAHIAARKLFPYGRAVPCKDFAAAYDAVERGECDCAVLPIENSYNGEVGQVTDLMFGGSLFINRVTELAIDQSLLGVEGATIDDIKEVISHPQALGQCAEYIKAKGFSVKEFSNTALAAEYVAKNGDKSVAAIASAEAAEIFGLNVMERAINTDRGNTTRFAVMTRAENFSHPPKSALCSLLLFTVKHEAGALAKALDIIGLHGFNMGVLRSRPTKDKQWQYYFYAELLGDVRSDAGRDMMRMLDRMCDKLKCVGVYEKGE